MHSKNKIQEACLAACGRLKIEPTRYVLTVNIADQTVSQFKDNKHVGKFPCSTSRFGIGQFEGSNFTPLGLHRIAEKISAGDCWPHDEAGERSAQAIGRRGGLEYVRRRASLSDVQRDRRRPGRLRLRLSPAGAGDRGGFASGENLRGRGGSGLLKPARQSVGRPGALQTKRELYVLMG